MSFSVDAVVIGAGVVGLACARRLTMAGLETVLLERERHFGQGISSRNSEVIHAGLYYRPGSLKAKLCRMGRERLYDYCKSRHVNHRRVGKWVVASSTGQLVALEQIASRAKANGCDEVSMIDGDYAASLEPELRCVAALSSPSTGIIDSHGLMTAFLGDFENAGGVLALCSSVESGEVGDNAIALNVHGDESSTISARFIINAAGLDAPMVAERIAGVPNHLIPRRCFAKGSYFTLSGKSPFQRLIYPVPESGGLGVHLTLDLQGQARFGPDVEWIETPDYTVDSGKTERFLQAIKTYWPRCDKSRLQPGYAGVRPKLGTPAKFADDFVIQSSENHGIGGLVNLFGIESPGLTSCLAIADEVISRMGID
ncbi:MAG: NAD(P)/FAD-dependent oxidoreductase [Candidatus Accumulibacter sp.]|uniref:NAD(P)/FAD-dependent oxidoreductase n=1 Tax=Candidatus Accumulibacter proximus TaxID=2954385 RepID=A0A935UFG9_9PROT|nr:NAD(P)/FAD-dependent oxidoreductase [Candidatus Accumulibacter proximus]